MKYKPGVYESMAVNGYRLAITPEQIVAIKTGPDRWEGPSILIESSEAQDRRLRDVSAVLTRKPHRDMLIDFDAVLNEARRTIATT